MDNRVCKDHCVCVDDFASVDECVCALDCQYQQTHLNQTFISNVACLVINTARNESCAKCFSNVEDCTHLLFAMT